MNPNSDRDGKYTPLRPPAELIPRHIAFIMDGNGRWARKQGLKRFLGHKQGAESLRRITRYCSRIGIEEVTFYALSTENYHRRPAAEISYLMKLLKDFLIGERQELADGNIRLRAIGRTDELPGDVQEELQRTMEGSSKNTGMILRLSLNYGGRCEILDGLRRICHQIADSKLDLSSIDEMDEEGFRDFLYDPMMAEPDIIIRTAGETRLSNFLLWQASYAEIWVTNVLWPDLDTDHLQEALRFYASRERKFGGLSPEEAKALEESAGKTPTSKNQPSKLIPRT